MGRDTGNSEDGALKAETTEPDTSNDYRYLSIQGSPLGGVGEIDYIKIWADAGSELPDFTIDRIRVDPESPRAWKRRIYTYTLLTKALIIIPPRAKHILWFAS